MNLTSPRPSFRARSVVLGVLVAIAGYAAIGLSTPASAEQMPAGSPAPRSLPPPPAGFVRLVDDTGTIRVVVPQSWTDVDTAPAVNDDGTPLPYIAASTDIESFQRSFDAPGVLFVALPFTADLQGVIDTSGLPSGCETLAVEPYSDPVFTGLVQVGTSCGTTGAATWTMVVANPPGSEFTAVVQVQAATAADQPAVDMVLATFDGVPPAGATPGSTPTPTTTGPASTVAPTSSTPTASTTASPAGSTTLPVTDPGLAPPAGYVRLLDDTGTITVVVPDTWTDVETHVLDDGELRRIAAAPDMGAFQSDEDGAGVNFIVQPFSPDPQAVVDEYSRPDSCAESGTQPYDDGVISGFLWLGSGCGPSGQGTWLVVVASPADQSLTYRVIARTATAADEPAVDMVLQTFDLAPAGSVAAATLPPSPLPPGATPTDVATAFVGALASGDGTTACALLSPEYVGNFDVGIRTCVDDLAARVAGQSAGWSAVEIVGEVLAESESCDPSNPAGGFAAVELAVGAEHGCVALGLVDGEWRIEDLSNSIWNAAAAVQ